MIQLFSNGLKPQAGIHIITYAHICYFLHIHVYTFTFPKNPGLPLSFWDTFRRWKTGGLYKSCQSSSLFYSHAECKQLLLDVPLVNDAWRGTYSIRYEIIGLDLILMLMLILMLLMLMVMVHYDVMIIVRQSCAFFFTDIVSIGQGVMSEQYPCVY